MNCCKNVYVTISKPAYGKPAFDNIWSKTNPSASHLEKGSKKWECIKYP